MVNGGESVPISEGSISGNDAGESRGLMDGSCVTVLSLKWNVFS